MIFIHTSHTQKLFTLHTHPLSILIFVEREFQQYLHCLLTPLPHLFVSVHLRRSAPPAAPGQGFSHTGGCLVSPPGPTYGWGLERGGRRLDVLVVLEVLEVVLGVLEVPVVIVGLRCLLP